MSSGNYPNVKVVIFILHYVSAITNLHEQFPDLICVLVSGNPIIQNGTSKRREIVVTNELREIIEADNKDTTVAPTKAMRRAIEVPLDHILDVLFAESQDSMYKFKAMIKDILNKDEPWYLLCKTCRKKVKVIEEATTCTNCNIDNVDYAMSNLQTRIFNCLYLIKKEECHYYRKLVLSKDKQFNFLVRIDLTDANPRRSLIAEEIHQVEDKAPIILEEEVRSERKYMKRAKKTTHAAAQINQKKPKAAKD
uniref:Replication factor A C-terminal domain-containing protein n=1 Tax=Solanum tuberosum TaxID=4113 RepID=M1DWE5_SOLTU